MSEPQSGTGDQPSFDKPTGGSSAPGPQGYPPQQPTPGQYPPQGYGQAPPPAYGAPGGGYPAQGQQGYGQELSPADQRLWATLAHAGGIFLSFIAPLVVLLVQKDKGVFVTEQAKEALNWQITLVIGYLVSSVLTLVIIGAFTGLILWVLAIVFGIIAAMAANKGENYRYPFALRLVK